MTKEHILETKLRASKFDSADAMRAALRADSLVPDFIYALMLARGVVDIKADGTIVGVMRAKRKEATMSGKWGESWPDRAVCLNLLENTSCNLSQFKELLHECGETTGHWACINALRTLMAAGIVAKKDGVYSLAVPKEASAPVTDTQVFAEVWARVTPAARAALQAALRKAGKDAKAVTALLGGTPAFKEWSQGAQGWNFSQKFIDWASHTHLPSAKGADKIEV